jgi:hypothetical protein
MRLNEAVRSRGWVFGAALLFSGLSVSCEPTQKSPQPLAFPVPALQQNDLLGRRSISQVKECYGKTKQNLENDPVAKLLLIYISSFRDFREPPGPDGYLFRIIPLNIEYHPIPVEADVTIALYRDRDFGKTQPWPGPLRIWQIPQNQIEKHWVISQELDGYLFRLDWGPQGPGLGNYRFLVRFEYLHNGKNITICRAMPFQDRQGQPKM